MAATPPPAAPSASPPALPLWVDGGLVTGTDAVVSALDVGLRSGWGVFETLRAHGTSTSSAQLHLERLGVGARRLRIPCDPDLIDRALQGVLAAPRTVHDVVVRITLTAGRLDAASGWPPTPSGPPTLVVSLHPAPALPLPAAHAVSTTARRWPADVKTTSYIASVLATQQARAAGAAIAVLTDGDELLETAEGNLFAVIDGTLVTPPDDGRLLAGVTRRLLLDAAAELAIPARTAALRARDVIRAETMAVSSSVGGLRTILSVDGQAPSWTRSGRSDSAATSQQAAPEHPTILALRDRLMSGWT